MSLQPSSSLAAPGRPWPPLAPLGWAWGGRGRPRLARGSQGRTWLQRQNKKTGEPERFFFCLCNQARPYLPLVSLGRLCLSRSAQTWLQVRPWLPRAGLGSPCLSKSAQAWLQRQKINLSGSRGFFLLSLQPSPSLAAPGRPWPPLSPQAGQGQPGTGLVAKEGQGRTRPARGSQGRAWLQRQKKKTSEA